MSKNARKVLYDCRIALEKYSDNLQAEDFRIAWFTIVALLRSVGHVLKTVDSMESKNMARAIDEGWNKLLRTKPEPSIFWEFIVEERNRVLKNYQYRVTRRGILEIDPECDNIVMTFDMTDSLGFHIESPQMKINSFISSGKYKDMSELKVAQEACKWWENYLDEIDILANKFENS